jgi:hypothetical protein
MFRRRPGIPGDDDASAYSRRSAVADSLWSAQDRIRSGFAAGLRGIADVVPRPFERLAYSSRKRLVWPLQDRAATMGAPARALSTLAAVLLAAGAGVAGLILAAPDGSNDPGTTQVAATGTPTKSKAPPAQQAEPTLQGAAPVFEPADSPPAEVDPAKAIVKAAPAESSAGADTAQSPSTAATSSAAKSPEIDGPPAGPEAIAVARDFAGAFVLYETGETNSAVRRALGESATPALARALLKRPPRLPANVEVPQAKVVNVVPAPSHGDVYPVSVSLLRVGLTSELRLDMERRKGEGWRVTNVLG